MTINRHLADESFSVPSFSNFDSNLRGSSVLLINLKSRPLPQAQQLMIVDV